MWPSPGGEETPVFGSIACRPSLHQWTVLFSRYLSFFSLIFCALSLGFFASYTNARIFTHAINPFARALDLFPTAHGQIIAPSLHLLLLPLCTYKHAEEWRAIRMPYRILMSRHASPRPRFDRNLRLKSGRRRKAFLDGSFLHENSGINSPKNQ